jgi:hypothetical protein
MSPGHQLEVQRSLLGYNSPMTATTIPLQPNEIVSVTVTPASVLCGIGEKIVLTVVLTRPLEAGDGLLLDIDSRSLSILKVPGATEYSYALDGELTDTNKLCARAENFQEKRVSLSVLLTSTDSHAPKKVAGELTLRPAKCRLRPSVEVHKFPAEGQVAQSLGNPQDDVRIIGNLVDNKWAPIRLQELSSDLWVLQNGLDCSSDPAVIEALQAKRFPAMDIPSTPTPTFTPVAPTPTPTATPVPAPTATPPIPMLDGTLGIAAGFRPRQDDPNVCVLESSGFTGVNEVWLRTKAPNLECGDDNGKVGLETKLDANGDSTGQLNWPNPIPCGQADRYQIEVATGDRDDPTYTCRAIPVIR